MVLETLKYVTVTSGPLGGQMPKWWNAQVVILVLNDIIIDNYFYRFFKMYCNHYWVLMNSDDWGWVTNDDTWHDRAQLLLEDVDFFILTAYYFVYYCYVNKM